MSQSLTGADTWPVWSGKAEDTVLHLLERRMATTPDQPVLDFRGEIYSYRRLDEESTRLAHGLRALGVKKGQAVTSILDNGPAPIVLMFACFKLGAIHVGVNTAFKGEFLRHQIVDSGASILVAESDYAGRILAIESDLSEAAHLLHLGDAPTAPSKRLKIAPFDSAFTTDLSPLGVEVRPSDLALLVYTGGTTGPSKGCMLSHNYAVALAKQLVEMGDLREDDVIWSPLPSFHFNLLANTIFSSMITGGRAAIYPKFSLSNFWPEIERTKATRASLMGAMVPLIAQAQDTDASRRCYGQLRGVSSAPFPKEMMDIWRERFGVQWPSGSVAFGLTECSLLTSTSIHDSNAPPGSSGKVNANFDVRVVDDDDCEVPVGEPGELICRPRKPHVMFEGYWRRAEETLKLWRNGWFHTGDIGRFDEQGYMYFVDRKKDYIRRRGENISTFEMDATFRCHPFIEDVAVHAVKSEFSEDDVKVTAVLREGCTMTEEEFCRWAVENVPYFAVPRYYEFRKLIPRSELGRVLKYQLRDEGVTPTTFDMDKAGIKFERR
jgi:crotonobetaine/carnitine-CoA ligase